MKKEDWKDIYLIIVFFIVCAWVIVLTKTASDFSKFKSDLKYTRIIYEYGKMKNLETGKWIRTIVFPYYEQTYYEGEKL